MIRRWSYLNTINCNFFNLSFIKLKKNYKIKNFKSAVILKRFKLKKTKFKRKWIARLKHNSNWLPYVNVIKYWVADYMLCKKHFRIQFLSQIFINNFFVYNFNFDKIRYDNFSYNFNFFFTIWPKTSYFFFKKMLIPWITHQNLTQIWFFSQESQFNNSVVPSYSQWDNNLYPNYLNNKKISLKLNTIFDFLFYTQLKYLIEYNKIINLLFINILNFKKLNIYVFRFIRNEQI